MWLCYKNMINYAVALLVFCGICDGVDGTIAKKIGKDGYEYGTQLDSLNDIVSSGVFPVIICMSMGYTSIIDIVVYTIFLICGITRLSYYNVKSSNEAHFTGVPITTTTIILPLIYLITKNEYVYIAGLFMLAILFVTGVKIPKPSLKIKILLSIVGIVAVSYIVFGLVR